MIHPDTELKLIDPAIGMGVVATRLIPRGTITWVHDSMDQTFSLSEVVELNKMFQPFIRKYAYLEGNGHYVLCWDHGRFVNHSCNPNCMAPGFDFEIAIRDIEPGEQLTGDYSAYNLETGFDCLCGDGRCRGRVEPEDRQHLVDSWNVQVFDAFVLLNNVNQPLWPLVREKVEVANALNDNSCLPACERHFFEGNPLREF